MSLPTELTSSQPQEWEESIEKILSELGDEAQINAYLHKKANDYYTTQNIIIELNAIRFLYISWFLLTS